MFSNKNEDLMFKFKGCYLQSEIARARGRR